MANQNLVAYVQKALAQGNDINNIRNYLLQQGFNRYDIEEAINFLDSRHVHHTIMLGKGTIIAIVCILAALGIFTYMVISLTSDQRTKTLLDFETTPLKNSLKSGEALQFNVLILNMGSSKRYDVTVTSTVLDSSGKLVTRKEDTFAVETRSSKTVQISMPNSKPGDYTLKSVAKYPGGRANSTFDFKVTKEGSTTKTPSCYDGIQNQEETGIDCGGPCRACASCNDKIKNQDEEGVDCGGACKKCSNPCENCDDANICTKDYCESGKCANEPIRPCCGDGICDDECKIDCPEENPKQVVEQAGQIAATDPDKAERMCKEITDQMYSDRCFELVAMNSKESKRCAQIQSESKRDACYMEFAMDGDYSVCDLVINPYLKKSCESLKYIKTSQ